MPLASQYPLICSGDHCFRSILPRMNACIKASIFRGLRVRCFASSANICAMLGKYLPLEQRLRLSSLLTAACDTPMARAISSCVFCLFSYGKLCTFASRLYVPFAFVLETAKWHFFQESPPYGGLSCSPVFITFQVELIGCRTKQNLEALRILSLLNSSFLIHN